jgi:hypothetical protein
MPPVDRAAVVRVPRVTHVNFGLGALLSGFVLVLFGAVALSTDVPRTALGFKSDEASYYMLGHSLAEDLDMTYRREDLARVWHEFPSGPLGVFLKKGRRDPHLVLSGAFPFVRLASAPDPDGTRLYYGKSYIYPLFAAPFVRVWGTNGFLVFHALLLALAVFAAYLFLNARGAAAASALIATAYVLASVASGYFVWMTPELFNFAVVTLGLFCWAYKLVAPDPLPPGLRWLLTGKSDIVAAILLACATFSKPPNALFILPVLAWSLSRRQWAHAVGIGVLFGMLVVALFGINTAVTGDWNYQGGERNTFYRDFPFLDADSGFDVGMTRATDRVLTEVIFDWSPNPGSALGYVFPTVLAHNLVWFWTGRHSGVVPYFFPAVFAVVCFLWPRARREWWQWMVCAVAFTEILVLIVWIPYNYFGGAGVLGNRYFMNFYGAFLFLLPPMHSVAAGFVPWIIGGLFTAQIALNPFYYSWKPHQHMKHGPLRLLPIELTLVNDLPINTDVERVRVLFGTTPRFQIYFLDDNTYTKEREFFWVRGKSRADLLFKTPDAVTRLKLTLAAGAVPADVVITAAGQRITRHFGQGEGGVVEIPIGPGFPYRGTRVWPVTIAVNSGFVPMFTSDSLDHRYLGVQVTPELIP